MIRIEHLAKHYGAVKAVDDLSFTVEPGRVTGFLGPNGAGKTTTLRVATNLVRPDAGTVKFDQRTYAQLKQPSRHVGVVLEPVVFHPGRTAMDHLMMLAPYSQTGRARCEEVLGMVGLSDVAGKRVGKFSLGMRGRLNLAVALLGDPATLLLDEPVNGLDPEGIRWIRELLRSLAAEGRTILISSHLLTEVAQTVDEAVIIAHGKLVYAGSLEGLEHHDTGAVVVETSAPTAVVGLAHAKGWQVVTGHERPDTVVIRGPSPNEVAVAVVGAGMPLDGLSRQSSDLESVFLALTEDEGGMR